MMPKSVAPAVALTFAAAFALAALPAAAIPWFPTEAGLTFTYENDFAATVIGGDGNEFWRAANLDRWPYLSRVEYFSLDPSGDVLCTGTGTGATGLIDIHRYDPPLTYLDFPLTAGKTWTSQATLVPDLGDEPTIVTLTGLVHGTGNITVPAGTFEIMLVELTLTGQDQGATPTTGFLFLHHQLGPVGGLVSWTGVVGTGPVLWGSLKAMFH